MMHNIIKQLTMIYFFQEYWHTSRMEYDVAYNYHKRMYDKGNIIAYVDDSGEVLGYLEFWKINASQLSRICNRERFNADGEDTNSGNICYVANLWIKHSERKSRIGRYLKKRLFGLTSDCKVYTGHEQKNNRRLRFYKNIHKGAENGSR